MHKARIFFVLSCPNTSLLQLPQVSYLHLSEEQLLECCNSNVTPTLCPVSAGCAGGSNSDGVTYAASFVLRPESMYPYISANLTAGAGGTCAQYRLDNRGLQLAHGPLAVAPGSKDALLQALQEGPVLIYFDALSGETEGGGRRAGSLSLRVWFDASSVSARTRAHLI